MHERFISQALTPVVSTSDTSLMAAGEPGLPQQFHWHGQTMEITGVIRTWRETGPCRHGSGERYVRKHWYELETASHGIAKVYFERQARGGSHTARWWLFSLTDAGGGPQLHRRVGGRGPR